MYTYTQEAQCKWLFFGSGSHLNSSSLNLDSENKTLTFYCLSNSPLCSRFPATTNSLEFRSRMPLSNNFHLDLHIQKLELIPDLKYQKAPEIRMLRYPLSWRFNWYNRRETFPEGHLSLLACEASQSTSVTHVKFPSSTWTSTAAPGLPEAALPLQIRIRSERGIWPDSDKHLHQTVPGS